MKITRPPKRLWPPLPQVAELIERVQAAPDEDLPSVLDSVHEWPWPRGDAHHWAQTLNRFDAILERTLTQYGITDLQYHQFTPHTKRLLVSILRFTRLLLESCTNRKIYNSYEHLRSLLVTDDVDVLEETLRLLLRPAQQHSAKGGTRAQELVQHGIVPQRLFTLGAVWASMGSGLSLADLASDNFVPPPGFDTVRIVVQRPVPDKVPEPRDKQSRSANRHPAAHRTPTTPGQQPAPPALDPDTSMSIDLGEPARGSAASPATSRPPRPTRSHSHHVTFAPGTASGAGSALASAPTAPAQETTSVVELRNLASQGKPLMDIVTDAIEVHKIPRESQFELFQRVRTVLAIYDTAARKKFMSCRLLALAVYGHVVLEDTALNELFMFAPEIARLIGGLVSPEHKIDRNVVSSAFYALEGLAKFRTRSSDVFTSIGISVNHGALLQNLRMLTNSIEALPLLPPSAAPTTPPYPWADEATSLATYADSIFGLLGAIINGRHSSYVAMIVGAGLMPLLIKIVQQCRSRIHLAQRSVARALGLIDSFIYATPPMAFTQFCDVGGPEVYVERIKQEVDYDIAHPEPENARLSTVRSEWAKPADNLYGYLSQPSSTLLRNILKYIGNMITTTGSGQLRNLIETSLPDSVIKIMDNRLVFGPQVLAVAINIVGNLVHNEPTSLVVVQEKKIPEKLFDLITVDIEANFELISTLPSVCSAMCLNQAGLDLFSRRMVARKLMRLLLDHRHIEVLEDLDNAILFGTSVDELIRHQPSAKEDVIAGIITALRETNKNAKDLSRRMERHPMIDDACRQAGLTEPAKQIFDLEKVTPEEEADVRALARPSVTLNDLFDDEDERQGKKDDANIYNGVIAQMDVTSRFMEGLFSTTSHCQTFADMGGLKDLLEFYDAPALPYNFLSSFASGSLANLLVLMTDSRATSVIYSMMDSVMVSVQATAALWDDKVWASNEQKPPFSPLDVFAPSDDATWSESNQLFRNLVFLNTKLFAIGELYQPFSYPSSSRPPQALFPALNNSQTGVKLGKSGTAPTFMSLLGMMLRHTMWMNLLLKAAVPPRQEGSEGGADAGKVSGPVQDIVNHLPNSGRSKSPSAPVGSSADVPAEKELSTSSEKGREVSEAVRQNVKVVRYTTSLMAQSLKAIHREVVRLLFFKTTTDPIARATTFATLGDIADTMLEGLKPRHSGSLSNDMAYATVMVDWIDNLLYERKGSRVNVSVMLLYEFFRRGGIMALVTQFHMMLTQMDKFLPGTQGDKSSIPESPEDANTLAQACGGLHVCLRMMHNLVTYRVTSEPVQLSALSQQYRNSNQECVVATIRLQIIHAVQTIWRKSWLPSLPLGIIRSLVKIILATLSRDDPSSDSSGESGGTLSMFNVPSIGTPLGSLTREGGSSARSLGGIPSVSQMFGDRSPSNVDMPLTELGFSREAVNAAFEPGTDQQTGLLRLLNRQGVEETPRDNSGAPTPTPASAVPGEQPSVAESSLGHTEAGPSPAGPQATTSHPLRPTGSEATVHKQVLMDELHAIQKELSSSVVVLILELAETHEPLVFEARDAVQLVSDKLAPIRHASDFVHSAQTEIEGLDSQGKTAERDALLGKVRVYLHFLAIVMNNEALRQVVDIDTAVSIIQTIQRLGHVEKKWVRNLTSHIFLIASEVFGWSERLESTSPYTESEWQAGQAPPTRPRVDPGDRLGLFEDDFFNMALSILRDETPEVWTTETLLGTYRLLVILTRRHHLACKIGYGDDELAILVRPFKCGASERIVPLCQSYLVTILRHVIEQPEVQRQLMFQMLRSAVHSTRNRHVMSTNLLNQVSSAVWRDPGAFFGVAKEHLKLVDYNRANPNARVSLIDDEDQEENGKEKETETDKEQDKPSDAILAGPVQPESSTAATAASGPASSAAPDPSIDAPDLSTCVEEEKHFPKLPQMTEVSDHLIHFFITELTTGPSVSASVVASETAEQESKEAAEDASGEQKSDKGKEAVSDPAPAPAPDTGSSSSSVPADVTDAQSTAEQPKPAAPTEEQIQADQQLYYNGFILQILAELLSSYDCCKLSLMNFTRKRTQPTPSAPSIASSAPPVKLRGTTVSTLFHELVALGTHADKDWRKCKALSNWLMSVIVALTADTTSNVSLQDLSADVISVRKAVLDGLSKSIRDVTASTEPLTSKGGKILVLSDLCFRLLTVKPNQSSMLRQNEDLSLHIAKLMLEKNFVLVLTNTITDIDLTMSPAKAILTSVLKPLDCLTKVAIRMGRAEKKDSRDDVPIELSSDEESTLSSMEDMDHDRGDRHETPDFYRNSSLGIHTGDLETGNYDDEVDDDESGEEDEDIEMEEYDHEHSGSDVTSDSDDVDDSDIDDEIDVDGMSSTDEESSSEDEDDDDDDHDHDHSDMFEDEWTSEDEGSEDDSENGELDIVIEQDGSGGSDRLVPTLEIDEIDMGRTDDLGSVFESEGEEAMDVAEEDEGSSNEGYDATGLGDLSLDDGYAPSPNTLDLFGANWAWVNPPAGTGRGGSGALFVPEPEAMTSWRSRLLDPRGRRNGTDDVASHPLLVDQSAVPDNGSVLASRPPGRRHRLHGGLHHSTMGLGAYHLEGTGSSTMQLLEAILERAQGLNRGDAVRFNRSGEESGDSSDAARRSDQPDGDKARSTDPVSLLQSFKPMSTPSRWLQDASLVHARSVNKLEHASLFRNELHAALLPAYWDAQKKQKEQEAERMAAMERKRKEEEEAKREKEEEERAERERIEAEERANQPPVQSSDTEMVDAAQASNAEATEGAGSAVEGTATAETQDGGQEERQTITIAGQEVDITGSGMDPEFLLALPEEMRQEIVEQHLRERQAETMSREQPATAIEPEFLAALPPEIRAEVIEQELIATRIRQSQQREREQREREAEQSAAQERARASEAGASAQATATNTAAPTQTQNPPAADKNTNSRRDAIQLLDRLGVLTLVRLLFFPELDPSASGLHRVLASVSENSKTRTDVLRMLLSILIEGTGTPAAVDRSYAAISSRIHQAHGTPSKGGKRPAVHQAPVSPLGQPIVSPISTQGEKAPFLMALRCIATITYLVDTNPVVSEWFLKEEVKPPKKGKGKEKATPCEPPIGLLLALLEQPVFLEHNTLLDDLIHALHLITKPLAKQAVAPPPPEQTPAQNAPAAQEESSAPAESAAEPSATSATSAQPEQATSDAPAPSGSLATEGDGDVSIAAGHEGDETMATEVPAGGETSGSDTVLAPQIPPERLSAVVRPLATPISSRGFQATLAVASNLAHVPGTRDVIRDAFMRSATQASETLMSDLDALLEVLPPKPVATEQDSGETPATAPSGPAPAQAAAGSSTAAPEAMQGIEAGDVSHDTQDSKLQSPALATLASPASAQAVLLRSLRALDYLLTGK